MEIPYLWLRGGVGWGLLQDIVTFKFWGKYRKMPWDYFKMPNKDDEDAQKNVIIEMLPN